MKQAIKCFFSYLLTKRLLHRLFLSSFAFLLLTEYPLAATSKKKSSTPNARYFQNIFLYPLGKIKVDQKLSEVIFYGHEESDLLASIQKKYFYYIPKTIHPQTNRTDSSYELIESIDKGKSIIQHKDSKIKVILLYKLTQNKEKLFTRKVTFIDGQLVDYIRYIYKKNELFYVSSKIYGRVYFQKPTGLLEKMSQYLSKLLN